MSSGDASEIVQCNIRIFDGFMLLSIKNGRRFPRTLCDVMYMLSVHPRYSAVIAAGDGHVRF